MNNGPRKLGKDDSRKSKIIDLDNLKDLKDKAITIKDKNKDKITGKGRSLVSGKKFSKDSRNDKKGKSLSSKGNGSRSSQKGSRTKLGILAGKSDDKNVVKLLSDRLKKIPGITDKKIISGVLIIILVCIIGALAVSSFNTTHNETNDTNTTTPTTNHYDNGLISFDYPLGWNIANGTSAPIIVTVAKNENNSFVVMNEDLKNLTFDERVSIWKDNILQSGSITHESNITMDGTKGYNVEFSSMVNNTIFNARGVAVSKNTTIYFVVFIFDSSLLDYKDDMDLVINSFHIIH